MHLYMTETITIKGKWFLPSNIELEVPGTLSYDPEKGVYLEIEASFSAHEKPFERDLANIDIILGESLDGESVTLYSCFLNNTQWGSSYRATWYADSAFIGCLATDKADLRFTEIVLKVRPLFLWLNSSGIRMGKLGSRNEPAIFSFDPPNNIEFPIDDKVLGAFRFTGWINYPNSYSETIGLTHSAELSIKVADDKDLHHDDLWTYVRRFLNWLTVVTGYPCEVEKLSFYHKDLTQFELVNGNKIPQEIINYTKKRTVIKKPERPDQFLFDFPKSKEYMPDALTRWFALYESVEVVIQILSENMGRDIAFSEFHFKDITQALEAFHRKRIRNERIPKADYKAYKARILNQISDEADRIFVKEKLNYGNEPSLRERLNELIERSDIPSLKSIIGDKEDFIKLVIDNRNYYTHLDANGKKTILDPTALYHLSEKALALLFVTIIIEVIPDKGFIDQILKSSRRWRFRINKESM